MAIIHPLKPHMSARNVIGVIVVVWIASAAIAFPNILYADLHTIQHTDGSSRTICYLNWPGGLYGKIDLM